MPVLSNKTFPDNHVLSTGKSFGPFIAIANDDFRFDTQIRESPIWLGHVASPMCGVLQHLECWTGDWTQEMLRIKEAYVRLLARTQDGLCGKLRLRNPQQFALENEAAQLKPAELVYQYIAISILDQYADAHERVARSIESNCQQLFERHSDLFAFNFIDGANFEFGFEFAEQRTYDQFFDALPKAGIHNKRIEAHRELPHRFPQRPSGEKRCVFTLNLAYRKHIELFWQRLGLVFSHFEDSTFEYCTCELNEAPDYSDLLEFQRILQAAQSSGEVPSRFKATVFLKTAFENRDLDLRPVIVDASNYQEFRQQILDMQIQVYEPTRRSPPEEFDMLFASENPLAIVVLDDDCIAAMVFAGRLALFRQERGVSTDPFVNDPSVYYSMDLTVDEKYRGGMGILMKQAMVMLAIDNGVAALHGRNRDRLAAGMWAINLSLGGYELQHLPDDYPDAEQHRDCIYYRSPLKWSQELRREDFQKLNNRLLLEGISLDTPFQLNQ